MVSLANLAAQFQGADETEQLFGFLEWVSEIRGLEPYPAQESALTSLAQGNNVILATPTGSGKSLVALGVHFYAMVRGERGVYTAPIKALVSEKFFELVAQFGAANVGMVTGDSAINPDAPIICCTAEILAHYALADEAAHGFTHIVMDEFHYYGDYDRGWAWQVPLLLANRAQFLLLSATLGDTTELAADLRQRTGRETELIGGMQRPVPLSYSYSVKPVDEAIKEAIAEHKAPIYVVHFSQLQAISRAKELAKQLGSTLVSGSTQDGTERAAALKQELSQFRFAKGFGQTLQSLLLKGIAVHHAGLLPKYRRLVERLAQQGLLRVICGTDTLGIGINVPIRTVFFTDLAKFRGGKAHRLSVREFQQIAGRAGRAGFDTAGDVIVSAPEYVIENAQAAAKRAAQLAKNPKKKIKVVTKSAPAGAIKWSEKTVENLKSGEPETLRSRFKITHSILLSILSRGETREGELLRFVRGFIFNSHEPEASRFDHARTAIAIYKTLREAGILRIETTTSGRLLRLSDAAGSQFGSALALNQPLAPFAVSAIMQLDRDDPQHALDTVSIIEAVLEDPRQVLNAQRDLLVKQLLAELKADGAEYHERMAQIGEVTHPQPLRDELEELFSEYVKESPWAAEHSLSPKSIVRDMLENAYNYRDLINHYSLANSEGVVLRYLSDAYKTLLRTVPEGAKTQQLREIIDWLGEMIKQIDSSLIAEWSTMQALESGELNPDAASDALAAPPETTELSETRAFLVMLRNVSSRVLTAAAFEQTELLVRLSNPETDSRVSNDPSLLARATQLGAMGRRAWDEALDAYFAEYDEILIDQRARDPKLLTITRDGETWLLRQTVPDPQANNDWAIYISVDIPASNAAGEPVYTVTAMTDSGEPG
ncbi:RNA helicase [Leucobacter sp. OH1287]|uniref:DEAD/DEAH box helicase n=1 Tax=Leucobacter sp. OH1287 TaxID=2491049 RepID=UPI000F5EB9C8|nr:DUF3516 domain-containing protein [Leucobacter sp. OH1287]RRD60642.1 DUF3516 domain-containing protein [Leucobacter sp. OH1287]